MARELVSDGLWEKVKHLIPPKKPQPKGARPWLDDRAALTGIIFVLRSGIPWEMLPKEMGMWFRDDLLATVTELA